MPHLIFSWPMPSSLIPTGHMPTLCLIAMRRLCLVIPLECFDHFCQLITPSHLASCVKLALALLNAGFSGPFLQHSALF